MCRDRCSRLALPSSRRLATGASRLVPASILVILLLGSIGEVANANPSPEVNPGDDLVRVCSPHLGAEVDKGSGPQVSAGNVPVVTAAGDQVDQAIVPDGAGGAIIAWEDHRGGGDALYAQHVLMDGSVDPTWPANGTLLAAAANSFVVLAMVSDRAGGAIVFWEDPTTLIRAQRVRSTGVVDPGWGPAGITVATTAAGGKILNAVSDRAGGAFVVWRDSRNGSSNTDIYAMHLTGSGVDPAWPANGLAVCTAPLAQNVPVLCSDGASGAIAVWCDRRVAANDYDIYAQHILINGTVDPGWPANGTAVVTRASGQRLYSTNNVFYVDSESSDNQGEAVIPDGNGGCLVTWTDGNTQATQDIYVHHVLSTGIVDPAWTAGGVAVCTQPAAQGFSSMVPDGAGGAIVTWADGRDGISPDFSQDIYAQHVLYTSAIAGPANGLAVLTGATGAFPHEVTDGAAGISVFWTDRRDSSTIGFDVYAQHVLTSPSLAVDSSWPAGGLAVSAVAGDQWIPTAVWNGGLGAIVTWGDRRNYATTGYDIYAEALTKRAAGVGATTQPPFALNALTPNPFWDAMTISLSLAQSVSVRLEVFDLSGRRVRTIVSGMQSAGRHDVQWDGTSDDGTALRAGVYLVSVRGGGFSATRRATLLR